jgi:hypothetical protein
VKIQNSIFYSQIEKIFTSLQFDGKYFFQIKLFQELEQEVMHLNPYKAHSLLKCHLVNLVTNKVVVVESAWILGHAALLSNPARTFGIHKETCSVVGLGDMVSFLYSNNPPLCIGALCINQQLYLIIFG